jgi:predicted glycosyltransferase
LANACAGVSLKGVATVELPRDGACADKAGTGARRVWLDIDNPPQVQYLYPFRAAFEARGCEVVVTARDYGNAVELLRQRTDDFHLVGRAFGASKLSKATGTLARARRLSALLKRVGRPDVLLAASRPAALTARRFGIPSFIVGDYEFANAGFYRHTGSFILHPDVVEPASFTEQGMRAERLIAFRGLKEDISFSEVDLDAVPAWPLPAGVNRETAIVLVRPPAEKSHYYEERSRALGLALLEHLAAREEATVVYAPRYPEQADDLARFEWRNEPVVLRESVPFVSLLKAVDLVVCSGGTFLREAAYLGIPAYSIFGSRIGGVDRHLERIGRVALISAPGELDRILLRKRGDLDRLASNPALLGVIVQLVEARLAALTNSPNG